MKHTVRQIIRYRFDNFMARGGRSIFIALVVVFVGLYATVACLRGIAVAIAPDLSAARASFTISTSPFCR